jgi:ornithine cyclodeaminase/alanine dehydrogenase-like protein (mu-crystallin family)
VVEIGECIDSENVTKTGATENGSEGGSDSAPRLVIFDSTGVAVQDVAIAELALEVLQAKARPTARL